MARVAEWGGPDSHCADRDREDAGLPAARLHPHERTADVRPGPDLALHTVSPYRHDLIVKNYFLHFFL